MHMYMGWGTKKGLMGFTYGIHTSYTILLYSFEHLFERLSGGTEDAVTVQFDLYEFQYESSKFIKT
ncbi:hypothetical protein BDW02DRAFT_568130 [Decorospora gaudefroyi]|uniref:Uncharacterized protein n=1 Tax=Decorospora gaudefroyi TaxID=184978 RepID=A0A6A5KI98_9PLEO|nr:hypothetical protein BDW02DRAFT_568130 [Decorospora gaudefroyi]